MTDQQQPQHTKAAARARFVELERRGQQLADAEQQKFAIYRDSAKIYELARLKDMKYSQRIQIVRRFKPRPVEQPK